MKTHNVILSAFLFGAMLVPAFATEGVPPGLAESRANKADRDEARMNRSEPSVEKPIPPYLHGMGEQSILPNPAFTPPWTERRDKDTQGSRRSIPESRHVGA